MVRCWETWRNWEVIALFTAAMVVLFLLRRDKNSHQYSQLAQDMHDNPHSDTYYEPKNDRCRND